MKTPRIIRPRDIEDNPEKAMKELNEAYLELHRWVQQLNQKVESHDWIINGQDT